MEWLGVVPTHWEATTVKTKYEIGKMLQSRPHKANDIEVPYLKAQHVQWFSVRTANAPKMWASQKDRMQFGIKPGDLLVCEGGEGGRCAIATEDVIGHIIQNALHRVRSRESEQRRSNFLLYALRTVADVGWLESLNDKATIAHFAKERFGALNVPIPPISEQTFIVRFLDHADRRIQRYIRAKEKLIALREEQKQAVIHQAITGQIDVRTGQPYPSYKPSGVEWLGDVPEHWDVRKFKHWLLMNQSTLSDGTDPNYSFDYLDIGTVGTGSLNSRPERIRFRNSPSRARRVVRAGDTLVSTVRTYLKAIWHAEQIDFDLIASTGFTVLTPRQETWPKFVSYLCQSDSFTEQVSINSVGVAYPAIAETKLGTLRIAVPPLPEQAVIARFLDKANASIDRGVAGARRQMDLLREYRTRLIADVVTGKLDVREVAARLPEVDPLAADDTLDSGSRTEDGLKPDDRIA